METALLWPETVNLSPQNNANFQWSGNDVVSFTGQISLALDSLKGNDTKLATLGETPSSQLRCFIGGKDVGIEGCKIDFKDDGLVFKNLTDNTATIVTQLSGKPSDQGFNSKTYAVEACGNSEFLRNKVVDVDLNYNCASSSTCSNKVALSNNNNTYELGLSADTFALQFDANSRAEFTVQYPDAGELSLTGTITDRAAITGSSNIFAVRPFGFAMDILNDSATSTNPNGYATNANGSLLKRTGETLLSVFAQCNGLMAKIIITMVYQIISQT